MFSPLPEIDQILVSAVNKEAAEKMRFSLGCVEAGSWDLRADSDNSPKLL